MIPEISERKILYSKPWLILAPHLIYPAHNGSDISLDRVARFVSLYVPHVVLISERLVIRYDKGEITDCIPFGNRMRTKRTAAVFTLLRFSHYPKEKFLLPSYVKVAGRYLEREEFGTVLYSYIFSLELFRKGSGIPRSRNHLVWTHNDDFEWFLNTMKHTRNPLVKWLSLLAIQYTKRMMKQYSGKAVFLAVTPSDLEGYLACNRNINGIVVRIGCDIAPLDSVLVLDSLVNSNKVHLSFVGSLHVGMNIDAVKYFRERFWPLFKERFNEDVIVNIAGSSPGREIEEICREEGWYLRADLSDEELESLMKYTDFSILPFEYSAGAKLKLLFSLGKGVPALSTACASDPEVNMQWPCLVSDEPAEWAAHVAANAAMARQQQIREGVITSVHRFSWQSSVQKLLSDLQENRSIV